MSSLPGVGSETPDPSQRSMFRSSWTTQEGVGTAMIVECKVVDLNPVLWTVDCISQFDQKWYLNIQVGSPYMHSKRGEGIYVMPEIGAKCHVCIPSDNCPPFVLDFIMPQESVLDATSDDAPEGTEKPTDSTFAGGRLRAKPGDIIMRGRDGNFVILHRGGVLQVGSSDLSQRIYIPLRNLVCDISQNYQHYNSGGSINWFLASGESDTNPSTIRKETYRLLAGDARATIRVAYGPLKDMVPEPQNGAQSDLSQLGIGTEEDGPVVVEVVIAPDGFSADNGSPDGSTPDQTVLRYFFDKKGSVFMRSEGSVLLHVRRKLRLVVGDNIDITAKKSFTLTVSDTARIDGGKLLELTGKVTKINGGTKPCAHVGSIVECHITVPWVVVAPGLPPAVIGTVLPINPLTGQPQTVKGTIVSGNPTIQV
jgi:hypothetical protein